MVTINGVSENIAESRDGYTYWPVPGGSTMNVVYGAGDDWQNHHIDITASGANVTIGNGTGWGDPQPGSWRIENVAIEGANDASPTPTFVVGTSDECTVRNVYMGDGDVSYPDWSNRFDYGAGLHFNRGHTGRADIIGVNSQGWIDNGVYGSAPSLESDGGDIHFQDCYVAYNNNGNLRLGRGSVDNCCVVVTGSGSNQGGWGLVLRDAGPTQVSDTVCYDESPSAGNSWGIVTLEGGSGEFTDVLYNTGTESGVAGGPTYTGTSGDASESDVFLPALCPGSAEAAYTGDPSGGSPTTPGRGGSGGSDFENRQIPFIEFNDMFLQQIDGIAVWAGSSNENAEYTVDNVHINNAEVGILADGGPVSVANSEIIADEPMATEGDGEISTSSVNTGGDATPERPEGCPVDAQDAMEEGGS